MERSPLKRRSLMACAGALLMSGGFAGLADAPETIGEPISVTARKMRFTKIEYSVRGPYLKGCVPVPSVGSPAADRVLCSMLQQCLLEGHSGEKRSKACLDERIRQFAEQDVPLETTDASFNSAPGEPLDNPQSDSPLAAEALSEITVTGSHARIPAGLWRFVEYSTFSTSKSRVWPPSANQWQSCMTDDDLHAFAKALQTPSTFVNDGMPPACRSWKIRIKGNAITGSSSCFLDAGAVDQGKLTGHIDVDRIEISKEKRFVMKTPRGPFFTVTRSELSAQRIGACTKR